jgi:hypothetical protein
MKNSKSFSHFYAESEAFQRLLLLIATLLRYPGLGSSDPLEQKTDEHHNALQEVQLRLQEVAHQVGISLPSYSTHTLRKDFVALRQWGILNKQMYRWGYYLGTGVMTFEELQVALNALYSQSRYQQDPQVKQIYEAVTRRLGKNSQLKDFYYPVRTHFDRAIIYTDPEEMMEKGKYRYTLFHHLKRLETAILKGQHIELFHSRNPYAKVGQGYLSVYPLQLLYSDIAWYLVTEDSNNGHLATVRIDRLSDHYRVLDADGRGIKAQWRSLQIAHRLLEVGWGLHLGNVEEQQRERGGGMSPVTVTVRFFQPVLDFILEGERRHPSQEIATGPKVDGKPSYVDYTVTLPPRSLNQFRLWVNRFMENAQVISPPELVEQCQKAAKIIYDRYHCG